jgi:hypothetical protein
MDGMDRMTKMTNAAARSLALAALRKGGTAAREATVAESRPRFPIPDSRFPTSHPAVSRSSALIAVPTGPGAPDPTRVGRSPCSYQRQPIATSAGCRTGSPFPVPWRYGLYSAAR